MIQPSIYLDYAAATPLDPKALQAATTYFADEFYNPSAVYQAARQVRKSLEAARAGVAHVLGAKDQEIIFTAGGTEANNLAIHSVMQNYPGQNIVVSSIEHESVLEPSGAYTRRVTSVTSQGILDLAQLKRAINDHTVMVSIMYANNEVGTIQPIKEIAKLIETIRQQRVQAGSNLPLYLHTDACQAANYLDLQVKRLGVDLMTLNGGKIYGMKQSGCLYMRSGIPVKPLITGGGQESGRRSGTENVPAQITFATMLQKVQNERQAETKRLSQLRNQLFATLSQKVPHIVLNGDAKKRLPNNLNLQIPGADGERLLMELDEAGLMVATGSACTASSDEPSHVLLAMGLTPAQASASLRITLGRSTTDSQIKQATECLGRIIQAHRG